MVGYCLYWGVELLVCLLLVYCVVSCIGLGGVVGKKCEYFSWCFVVDFEGGELVRLIDKVEVEVVVEVSCGWVEIVLVCLLCEINGYCVMFDLVLLEGSIE